MSRRKLREKLFSLLFRVEFNSVEEMQEQKALFFDEEELEEEVIADLDNRFDDIISHMEEIDNELASKMTGWDINRIGKVELTIMRLALYEMKYDEGVPEKAAINEAVELTKIYGQDGSAGFVNGVLAKFVNKPSEDSISDSIGSADEAENDAKAKGSTKRGRQDAQIVVKKSTKRQKKNR